MFLEFLNIPQFDYNHNNSTQVSSPNVESNDSSDDFAANEPSTSKKSGSTHGVSYPYGSGRGVQTRSCDRSKHIHPTNSELE